MNVNACPHPPERAYAWGVDDPAGHTVLCLGCTACGAVLSGAVDAGGSPVGPQRRIPRPPQPRAHAKTKATSKEPHHA